MAREAPRQPVRLERDVAPPAPGRSLADRAFTTVAHEARTLPIGDSEPAEDPARFGPDGSWTSPVAHWSEAVDDRVAAEALTGRVRDAIASLPSSQRQVVTLRDVEGLSRAEVCEALNLTDGHQRVLLHRGRVAVRRSIESQQRGGE